MLALLIAAVGWPGAARAGQVRVTVSSFQFTSSNVSCNLGDQIVWVWVNSGHSVTSGDPSGPTPDGHFNSAVQSFSAGNFASFSWRSNLTAVQLYYCIPHVSFGMTGQVNVMAGPGDVAVADFRIYRLQYNRGAGEGLFEIANLGGAPGDLGRYRIVASNDTATVPLNSFVVPAGGRVRVHVNKPGAQSAPDSLFLPTLADLPAEGSLALYVPNTAAAGVGGTSSLTDATQAIDFLEWGAAAGQANEATAVTAGLWTAGQVLGPLGPGFGFQFCGARQYGANFWQQVGPFDWGPPFVCLTPTVRTTWGRMKLMYR